MPKPLFKVLKVPENRLLRDEGKEISLQELLDFQKSLQHAYSLEREDVHISDTNLGKSLRSISEEEIERIYTVYGSTGLFKLVFLAQVEKPERFSHFYSCLYDNLFFMSWSDIEESSTIKFDNEALLECQNIRNFNHNVLFPDLSRKLFNPGTHPGYLVYGFGGARILVSHPFRGINGEFYNVYQNSVDVVTSLNMRGFYGSFLFLDNIGGLNYKLNDVDAWLAWFSLIASHSDLVLFVKESEDFTLSQKKEIAYTPNRVHKKIVDIPADELHWAETPSDGNADAYLDDKGNVISIEEFHRLQGEHTKSLLEGYAESGLPRDRIIKIDEEAHITEYPINYPAYE